MKKTSLVQKATLFCLAAALSMGIAKAGTTNLIFNYSFEIPGTGKIASGFDTVPGWFSSNPSPPATPDSGIQAGEDAPDGPFGPFNVNNYDAYTKGTDGYHARQTTSHLIQQGECFKVSYWAKNDWVFGNATSWTNGYWTVVLYYGGTQNVVVGGTNNASLGTVGTPFYTNNMSILPAPGTTHSHTTPADWTNYFFGVITDAVPALAFNQPLGIDIWNSTTQYNAGAGLVWLDIDDVVVYATNGISPIATPIVVTPTNTVWTGGTLYFTENAFGSTPMNYEWQTDGGIPGGPMTDVPGAPNTNVLTVAASSTTASTNNYRVIINNNYGSVTSTLAPYYVLGAVPPSITQQTGTADWGTITNIFAFVGGNVNLYASSYGAPIMTNQWDVKLDSGGGYTTIAGATNFLRVLTNVQTTKAGYYLLGATNGYGFSNSTPAHLTALAVPAALPAPANGYTTNMYSYGIYTNHPWAYWKFEETNDTLSQSMQAYDYSGHNFNATYGNSDGTIGSGCLDGGGTIKSTGQYGPGNNNDGYSGFTSLNGCSTMAYNKDNGYLTVPPLNLNTNAVTFTMWIYINPNDNIITSGQGLFMNRNGSDAAGIFFGTNVRTNFPGYTSGVSIAELGYAWNSNSAATTGWHSGLYPWPGTWNFVACVITNNSTTMYLYNAVSGSYGSTNLYKAVNNSVTNGPEAFSVASWLGSDGYNGSTFDGYIDEVAVFTNAMSEKQIQYLFLTSLGLTNGVAPNILTQPPSSISIYTGQPLLLSVLDGGIPTPTNAWRCSVDGTTWMIITNGNASGTNSPNLVVNNFPPNKWVAGATNFEVIVGNGVGNNVISTITTVKTYPAIPNYNNGAWVMNFAIATTNQNGTGNPYTGRGVLGSVSDSYWNALSAYTGQVTNVTAYRDDGTANPATTNVVFSSPVGAGLGSGSSLWTGVTNNMLLDTYIIVHGTTNNPTPFVFSNIPNGRYNLALYGCVGSWLNRAIQFTVLTNGVSAGSVDMTNKQDLLFAPNDNTAVFPGLLVVNGKLEVDVAAWPAPAPNTNATECEFNGVQLELVNYVYLPTFSSTNIGGNTVLNWSYGMLLQATNVFGPWTTNVATTASGSYTINPTGYMRFFRVYNPTNL